MSSVNTWNAPGWRFRIAVAFGELTDSPNNVSGAAINTAAKLGKFSRDDPDAAERVLLTPDVREACSPCLREELSTAMPHEAQIAPDLAFGPAGELAVFQPFVVAAEPAVRALLERDALTGAAPEAASEAALSVEATVESPGD